MSPSIWQILVVGLLVVLLFGRGKISEMMGDVAKGIKAFKKGMSEDEIAAKAEEEKAEQKAIEHQATAKMEAKDASVQKKAG
ncbi:MAG: twin-arginine translocase TatA/TatE family subunit [Salinarimonadaceae bacterium]|nr:MAG: twin-arginine translocase TatA/TatE family subunit [Salinarimonadaceae bacterium]